MWTQIWRLDIWGSSISNITLTLESVFYSSDTVCVCVVFFWPLGHTAEQAERRTTPDCWTRTVLPSPPWRSVNTTTPYIHLRWERVMMFDFTCANLHGLSVVAEFLQDAQTHHAHTRLFILLFLCRRFLWCVATFVGLQFRSFTRWRFVCFWACCIMGFVVFLFALCCWILGCGVSGDESLKSLEYILCKTITQSMTSWKPAATFWPQMKAGGGSPVDVVCMQPERSHSRTWARSERSNRPPAASGWWAYPSPSEAAWLQAAGEAHTCNWLINQYLVYTMVWIWIKNVDDISLPM